MKPLEPVEEEMLENSELETPHSEVVEVTRKKRNSNNPYCDVADSQRSHNSSLTDKYASSSRRQSQLLEAQDTQNLIDHDLLGRQPIISVTSSIRNSQNRLTPISSQTNIGQDQKEPKNIQIRKSTF